MNQEIMDLAREIRSSDIWDLDKLAALCEAADMEAEWAAADGETFEAVAFATAWQQDLIDLYRYER